jgi:hypothetical protein
MLRNEKRADGAGLDRPWTKTLRLGTIHIGQAEHIQSRLCYFLLSIISIMIQQAKETFVSVYLIVWDDHRNERDRNIRWWTGYYHAEHIGLSAPTARPDILASDRSGYRGNIIRQLRCVVP